jgi:hypothetical protein
MQNPFVYPGRGKILRKVTGSTLNLATNPETTTIPNNGYSETVQFHEGLEAGFEFVFGSAASGDVLVEKVADPTAAVAGTTFDTISASSELSKNWNAGEFLIGSFRIKNTSGQDVTVYYNNRLS